MILDKKGEVAPGNEVDEIEPSKRIHPEGLVPCNKMKFSEDQLQSVNLHACITTKNIPVRLDFYKLALFLTANFLYFVYISLEIS